MENVESMEHGEPIGRPESLDFPIVGSEIDFQSYRGPVVFKNCQNTYYTTSCGKKNL